MKSVRKWSKDGGSSYPGCTREVKGELEMREASMQREPRSQEKENKRVVRLRLVLVFMFIIFDVEGGEKVE